MGAVTTKHKSILNLSESLSAFEPWLAFDSSWQSCQRLYSALENSGLD